MGKIAAICLAGALLLVSATVLTSQTTTPPPASTPPASQSAAASQDQAAPAQPVDEWPNGTGKQTFLQTCSSCHSPENVIGQNKTADGWTDTLNQMIQFGAQGSDDDFTAILNYLTTYFGPAPAKIDMDKVNAMNLRNWLGMSPDLAQAIIDYRTKNGNFKSLDDLKKVPGVDPKTLDSMKDILTFGT